MAEPFSPEVADQLIRERPGRTAEEIVSDALSRGIIGSRSRNFAIASQGGALVKMYQQGRLAQVWRDESQRPYRYYPAGYREDPDSRKIAGPSVEPVSAVVSFRPTQKQERVVAALVAVGIAASRSEAVHWLLDQGIAAKSDFVERAIATQAQIEELRTGMRVPNE